MRREEESMSAINILVLSGRLGAPPEERSSDLDRKICSFRLANDRWDSKKKEKVTDWYSVTAYGPVAETCLKFLSKGSEVIVEGRCVLKEWDTKAGVRQKSAEVWANRVVFVGSPRGEAREVSSGHERIEAKAGGDDRGRREPGEAPEHRPGRGPVSAFDPESVPF